MLRRGPQRPQPTSASASCTASWITARSTATSLTLSSISSSAMIVYCGRDISSNRRRRAATGVTPVFVQSRWTSRSDAHVQMFPSPTAPTHCGSPSRKSATHLLVGLPQEVLHIHVLGRMRHTAVRA